MTLFHLPIAAVAYLLATPAFAQSFAGRVVGVADGDTITVLDADRKQHKIRVAGIDAPEKKQPFGQKSKASMSDLVFNRDVEIVGDKRDRYGRTVAKVMVADSNCNAPDCPKTRDVGLIQIMSGLAWWYRKYAREQTPPDRVAYESAEALARERRAGLWADSSPVPPWEWRHR
jgi:endonuclease YncB( thermonuclease family)